MRHDIEAYNRATVDSETDMLLYNIGRLHENQPPHFMMLSSVSQSRSFSATAGFQWTQALAAINPATMIENAVTKTKKVITTTTTSSDIATGSTWEAGPFTAGTVENPTITFVPIQGQDFANRFESPLRDKFTYFIEDKEWYATAAEKEAIVQLFAQSLYLMHGDDDSCQPGFYVNRAPLPQDLHANQTHYYSQLSACLKEIVERRYPNAWVIDGHHPVPTNASADPAAADVVTALGANYEWTKKGKDFALTTPVRIPAWLDYIPDSDQHEQSDLSLDPVLMHQESEPRPVDLVYGTPKGYMWKQYTNERGRLSYALVPDGYTIRDGNLAKVDKCGEVECESGTCDAGKCVMGKCVSQTCQATKCESGECESDKTKLLYSDKIVNYVWPVPQDYFYLEFRRNDDPQHLGISPVYNKTAEDACFGRPQSPDEKKNDIVCGYLKIGNLLQIMQRLATLVCTDTPTTDAFKGRCDDANIFAVGPRVPAWAERKTPIGGNEYIWEPAHNPQVDPNGLRDQQTFSSLYKLYQMSLVDTSKLVTGAPPITISK
jgi:hypothetical protein